MESVQQSKEDILLQGMINLPVSKPTWLNQCGTWSIVYPNEYTRKKELSCSQTAVQSKTST
jgi:hypothetical protein